MLRFGPQPYMYTFLKVHFHAPVYENAETSPKFVVNCHSENLRRIDNLSILRIACSHVGRLVDQLGSPIYGLLVSFLHDNHAVLAITGARARC